jgi:hypothetical protein
MDNGCMNVKLKEEKREQRGSEEVDEGKHEPKSQRVYVYVWYVLQERRGVKKETTSHVARFFSFLFVVWQVTTRARRGVWAKMNDNEYQYRRGGQIDSHLTGCTSAPFFFFFS